MLQVQVHIKLPKPRAGVEYTKALMDDIADRWLKGERLPRSIKVTALTWRTLPNGRPTMTKDPNAILRAREDFRFMVQAGFEFTGFQAVG